MAFLVVVNIEIVTCSKYKNIIHEVDWIKQKNHQNSDGFFVFKSSTILKE